ncbi:unnamed protein product [Rotaria sp. Silwood1]|nr:unnamed protein product [Rotaria sp. Silwood1]CAF1320329.1 unnamed protein product [Rotaria sp. Silwood1]CAF3486632.1 unnamed protein product [Rotaria sp. Silwood1]CAF4873959.1 unnamed protein product [Rotaria sp. Silwood1]
MSPNGRYLLIYSQRPAWDSNSFENSLWLYETYGRRKQLITKQLSEIMQPKWSPSGDWFVFLINDKAVADSTDDLHRFRRSVDNQPKNEQQIHLYSVSSDELLSIEIGNQIPLALAWSDVDSSLYFAAQSSQSTKDADHSYEAKWKDVIQYRRRKPTDDSTIYRIDISIKNRRVSSKINFVKHLNFIVGELLFVPSEHKLVCTSVVAIVENLSDIEMYSIDLYKSSSLTRLTNNEGIENNLRLSSDGKYVFFQVFSVRSSNEKFNNTQIRLYSIDLTNGQIQNWGKGFEGNVRDYAIRSEGGVFILGQLGTNVHIYTQQSPSKYLFMERGWNGTYRMISSSTSKRYSSVAFLHSSFEQPEEVYFVDHIDDLRSAKAITSGNQLFTKRDLPRAKLYKWTNNDDDRMIEGILHYPPGKFERKNLPLLVLIHGGPTDANLNIFLPDWYSWAPLAATEGWLVLEPNYRGSTGYGDQFLNEITCQPLSLPGKDILAGVDRLIKDGIADPTRLTIGGYSYGGYLTNWLITQTTRFNAALSGAGGVEHVSSWGTSDFPTYLNTIFGGLPWEIPQIYSKQSVMEKLDKIHTPTHIITGANDIRVSADQSVMLARGLNYLGVPVKLLLFPNEGHSLSNNPWHGKIKIREELKWLEKYGHVSLVTTTN